MADIVDEAKCIVALRGDTYSSYEVLGALERAAAEIERLRSALAVTHATIDDKNRRLAAIRGVLNSDNEQPPKSDI